MHSKRAFHSMQRRAVPRSTRGVSLAAFSTGLPKKPDSVTFPSGHTSMSCRFSDCACASSVQLGSSTVGGGRAQTEPSQRPSPWHGVAGSHWKPSGRSLTTHLASTHTSATSHPRRGPQKVPSGAFASPQPFTGSHTPTWHTPSPGHGGAGTDWHPSSGLHTSVVQALPSSHTRSWPLQWPAWHVAPTTHSLPGSHATPSGSCASTQCSAVTSKVKLWQASGVGQAGMASPSPVIVSVTVPPPEAVPVNVAEYGPGAVGAKRTLTSGSSVPIRSGSPSTVKGASTGDQLISSDERPALRT